MLRNNETEPRIMRSPEQFAKQVGVPVKTVYGWNYRGTGPRYVRVGRHVRYFQADIDVWLRQRTVTPS